MNEPLVPQTDYIQADGPKLLRADITALIIKIIRQKTRRLITKDAARTVYEAIMQVAVTEAIRTGEFTFPGGFGKLHVKWKRSQRQRVFGEEKIIPARAHLKFQEGAATRELLGRSWAQDRRRRRPRVMHVKPPQPLPETELQDPPVED